MVVEPWNEAGTTNPASLNTQNIYQSGNVGIGNNDPQNALHVTANENPVRFEGLKEGAITDKMVVVDTNGVLKTMGQFQIETMRIGVNGITASASYPIDLLSALRFNKYNDDNELGTTPSGNGNFVNTITGSSFTEGVTLSSFPVLTGENTVPANRTTDVINLPAGLYEITFRIKGIYDGVGGNGSSTNILLSVNNQYHNKTYTSDFGGQGINTSSFILSLSVDSSIDFLIEPYTYGNSGNFILQDVGVFTPFDGCGKPIQVMQSEIIIKKIGQDNTPRTCSA